MDTLVLAEKPSVARDLARVLGANKKGEGCLMGSGYIVTWALGHLVTLKEPDELDPKYKRWQRETLPILPGRLETKVIPKTRAQFSLIRNWMRSPDVSDVICATDSGREGELIFRYIYERAGCKKPVRRLWISSMTDEAIRKGLDALRPAEDYDALYRSARCRADADWLIGMNATRAYTLRYGVLLSIGRVQTPTLAMLVRRRQEIDRFKPEQYYTVRADFGDYSGVYQDVEGTRRIATREEAEQIAARDEKKAARVEEVVQEQKAERPPLLYDLTGLQRDANARFGFTAKHTLEIAQKLYEERKLLTYPRTDSNHLGTDMQEVVQKTLAAYDGPLAEVGQRALSYGIPKTPRVFDDAKLSDHHAIIPTGKPTQHLALAEDERKLYTMVATRLAAAFYPNYRYCAVRVITQVGEDRYLSTGRVVLDKGWKALYADDRKAKEKEGEEPLPQLTEGDVRSCRRATVREEATKPPKEMTDASLLACMEHAGREVQDEELRQELRDLALGTPATRAAILERLIEVGYVRRKGKILTATEKGVRLIEVVPPEISSAETTGRWEKALAEIARGAQKEPAFRSGIARMAAFLVQSADAGKPVSFPEETKKRAGKRRARPALGVCPLCKTGKVAENTKSFYCTRFQEGCSFQVWKDAFQRQGGPEITAKLIELCLQRGEVRGSTGTLILRDGKLTYRPKE